MLDNNEDMKKAVTHSNGNIYMLPILKDTEGEANAFNTFFLTINAPFPEGVVMLVSSYNAIISQWDKYEATKGESITIMVAAEQDSDIVSMLKKVSEIKDISTNIISLDTSKINEQINLVIAAGEPAVYFGPNLEGELLDRFAEQGVMVRLDQLIERYAPNI